MTDAEIIGGARDLKTRLDIVSLVISVLALATSVGSAYYVSMQHGDTEQATLLRQTYSDFAELNDVSIDNWESVYMFALPDQYESLVKSIGDVIARRSDSEKAQLKLRERAIAEAVFTRYEHAYYQWQHATHVGDKARETFLLQVLQYFTKKLLRNPRLLWYWSEHGANLRAHFEADVTRYYDEQVLKDHANQIVKSPDAIGLFSNAAGPPQRK
jgi:hypothetical protein